MMDIVAIFGRYNLPNDVLFNLSEGRKHFYIASVCVALPG